MPPLLADFTHARPCKPKCEKYLTLPRAEWRLDFAAFPAYNKKQESILTLRFCSGGICVEGAAKSRKYHELAAPFWGAASFYF